jgi:hypothetical protein
MISGGVLRRPLTFKVGEDPIQHDSAAVGAGESDAFETPCPLFGKPAGNSLLVGSENVDGESGGLSQGSVHVG